MIMRQLADIQSGIRPSPVMSAFATPEVLGGPQGIADAAYYIASLPMNPLPGYGPGTDVARGKTLYKTYCAKCHGPQGEGSDSRFKPRVQGQHFRYLLRRMKWYRDERPRGVDKGMLKTMRRKRDEELESVADFLSRTPPPEHLIAPIGWRNPDFP